MKRSFEKEVVTEKSGLLQSNEVSKRKFPHYGQYLEAIKQLVGVDEFRKFIEYYIYKTPENTILLKQAMKAIEKEGEYLEAQENEKFLSAGLQMPILSSRGGHNQQF